MTSVTQPAYPPNLPSLQVVPLAQVILHERVDPRRVAKLTRRLQTDGRLINPPIAVALNNRYIILDGATRTEAFRQLGYPYLIVQVIPDKHQLGLYTWLHGLCQTDPAELVNLFNNLPEITLNAAGADLLPDEILAAGAVCGLRTITGQNFLIQPAPGFDPLVALGKLTQTYIGACHIIRTLNPNLTSLRQEVADLTALVVFPPYTVDRVLQIAQAGQVLPAGITRFIIPGRVLHLNVELQPLISNGSLPEKNEWLTRLLLDKLNQHKIRYYQEPVYLLDD